MQSRTIAAQVDGRFFLLPILVLFHFASYPEPLRGILKKTNVSLLMPVT